MRRDLLSHIHWRSQGVHWVHVHPRAEKKLAKFTGKSCKCTSRQSKSFFEEIGEIWRLGVVKVVIYSLCFEGDD